MKILIKSIKTDKNSFVLKKCKKLSKSYKDTCILCKKLVILNNSKERTVVFDFRR